MAGTYTTVWGPLFLLEHGCRGVGEVARGGHVEKRLGAARRAPVAEAGDQTRFSSAVESPYPETVPSTTTLRAGTSFTWLKVIVCPCDTPVLLDCVHPFVSPHSAPLFFPTAGGRRATEVSGIVVAPRASCRGGDKR